MLVDRFSVPHGITAIQSQRNAEVYMNYKRIGLLAQASY